MSILIGSFRGVMGELLKLFHFPSKNKIINTRATVGLNNNIRFWCRMYTFDTLVKGYKDNHVLNTV